MPYNIHPPLAHFPIVLLIVTLGCEVFGLVFKTQVLRPVAKVNFYLAIAAVVGAFLSGYVGADFASRQFTVPEHEISEHHNIGRLLLFATVPCLALFEASRRATNNQGVFNALYLIFLTGCVVLAVITGALGGELVFEYGAGVLIEQ